MTRVQPIKPAVIGLALLSLFFAILLPPEAYPVGRMAIILTSTFAFVIAVLERRVSNAYLLSGVATFPALLVHSLWISVDLNRSLEFLTILWAYYCLLGFFYVVHAQNIGSFG